MNDLVPAIKHLKFIEGVLKFLVLAILFLTTLVFLFVFVFNWEDWFFGMKLDGTPAGVYLLLKSLAAGILFFLVLRYPEKSRRITCLTILYFGFILADSSVTIQKNSDGHSTVSPVLTVFFIIPVVLLVVQSVAAIYSRNGVVTQ